jgi:hypothetical protein
MEDPADHEIEWTHTIDLDQQVAHPFTGTAVFLMHPCVRRFGTTSGHHQACNSITALDTQAEVLFFCQQ